VQDEDGVPWFVGELHDVRTQLSTNNALHTVATGASVEESAEAIRLAAHQFGGVRGAQMVWVTAGVVRTAGDKGSCLADIEASWSGLSEMSEPTILSAAPAYDWCFGFPLSTAQERLGSMVVWGVGASPSLTFTQVALEPLLDLASLAVARSRELSVLNTRATTDHVTGLLNRHAFFFGLDQPVPSGMVGYVDLDGFKAVNDQYGHTIGDQLLRVVARRLSTVVRGRGSICRMGGDEFAIAHVGRGTESDATAAAEVLSQALNETVEIDGHQSF